MAFAPRFLRSPRRLDLAGRHVKVYDINIDDRGVEADVARAAEAFLPRLFPTAPDATPPATFAIVHRGAEAAYLLAYSWIWDNVVECRAATAGLPSLGCPDRDPRHFAVLERPWIGCVWELAPFEHERAAWVRHMLEPERPDLASYLADLLPAGPIGGSQRARASS